VKRRRKAMNKTPRDIIGDENVMALKQAGFVVVRLSELSKVRAIETEVATSRTLEQIAFGNLRPHLFRVEVQLTPSILASGLS
jgi:hypothetical protein